jgi:hypothetical protein
LQNGTLVNVNGERIQGRPLVAADRIVSGDTRLNCRTPWPEPST